MGVKFIVKENLKRVVDYDIQGDELVLKDRFEGFNIVEDSEKTKLSVFFKDIDRNLNVVQRFFEIDKEEVDKLIEIYNQYEKCPTDRYIKMLELKKQSFNKSAAEEIYEEHYLFFVAGNITQKEWYQFVGFEN